MGCGISLTDEQELLHTAPDFGIAGTKKTEPHNSDFTCKFDAAFFGQIYIENVQIIKLETGFRYPRIQPHKDIYEDGIPFFKEIPHTISAISLQVAVQLLQIQFPHMSILDIQNLIKYVQLNRAQNPFKSKDFQRLAYLCYRFCAIIDCPASALFYWLDDYRSGLVASKKLKQIISQHYGVKRESAVFSGHYVDLITFLNLIVKLAKRGIQDPLAGLISNQGRAQIVDFDESLMPINSDEEEISDVSTGKAKAAKVRKLKRRAEALNWSEQELEEAIRHVTKRGMLKNIDLLEGDIFE
ncbi:hypothetical protein SS50377_28112 [Spironucleus salmonicida]|uniref:Uncharacterized protein n=1 Tax=Spironucleus salmonicida TaxID=348837 RepID=V6LE97_9EUKA|nr:hypothetical protein SS50377_28112 [Spironucleus salmonicida]|eukprot:EST42797.1 hypothetical protein SS50377_17566 [Spironucleus salmonicida]